jgi:iron complex outermembrane receptor protein
MSAEATVYHNQFNNFIYLNPSNTLQLTIRGAFPVFNYLQDNVRISGIDFKTNYILLSVYRKQQISKILNHV